MIARTIGFTLAVALAFAVAACGPSTSGRQFSFEPLKTFIAGQTNEAGVMKALGAPQSKTTAEGVDAWLYHFTSAEMTGAIVKSMTTYQRGAVVAFKDKTMLTAEWWIQSIKSEGFGGAGKKVTPAALSALEVGAATPQDAHKALGDPQRWIWRHDGSETLIYVHSTVGGSTESTTLNFRDGKLSEVKLPEA